ncbi:MAG TPA: sn-glycerol-3-phosphate ABC transporter ATP-binding protein UgpC [Actinokineospora sp.]|nr:sn-glycerol-3-phosphate ABC transporter ATP-binding protein UgpC [Actinokineospora sp.]
MATITYQQATRRYSEASAPAVDALDLHIEDGEFLVLVGPSGCGKTTSLRMLAGLENVDGGSIRIDGRDVTALPAKDRDIAMVFQSYALYPHMTVGENMAFGLKMAKMGTAEIRGRVATAAKMLDLEPYLDRKPAKLSGGQRQRVAMGRAIVREPRVFCMDEPLSNLDAKLRVSTRARISALQRDLGITTVYVTHDQVEAMTMGDRVAVLKDGALQQCDTPRALYERPATEFVAGFIGSPAMNLVQAPVTGGFARLGALAIPVPRTAAGGALVTVGFRPGDVDLVASTDGGLAARVTHVEELGSDAYAYAAIDGTGRDTRVVARVAPYGAPMVGSTINLRVRPGRVHLFDGTTGHRIE